MRDFKAFFAGLFILFLASITLSGCKVIGDIFSAGVWVGVIGVIIVVALVIWLISKAGGSK
jgi:cytosine/uracil/thiamine/allantoin permease